MNDLGCDDVPSADAPNVTNGIHRGSGFKVWETMRDDLTPSSDLPHRSPRVYFWSRALAERHELYHCKDNLAYVLGRGQREIQTTLAASSVASKLTSASVVAALQKALEQLFDLAGLYQGIQLPNDAQPGEIRAYRDGRWSYQALADAIAARGRQLDRAEHGGQRGR